MEPSLNDDEGGEKDVATNATTQSEVLEVLIKQQGFPKSLTVSLELKMTRGPASFLRCKRISCHSVYMAYMAQLARIKWS